MDNRKIVLLLALGASLFIGCSPLAPQPDQSKFFVLTPLSDERAAATPVGASQPLTIGVGPVEFPDYLRRLEVVTRTSPNQLDLSPDQRWAEPLDKDFTRVLSENLSRLLNTQRLEKYPWSRGTQIDFQVSVVVLRFETSSDGKAQLVARWIVKDGSTGKDLAASETKVSEAVGSGEGGGSAALSADLATMSQEIASSITTLSQNSQRTAQTVRPGGYPLN